MRFSVVTLFPEYFASPLGVGILQRARSEGLVRVDLVDLRAFGEGRHRAVDDYPFGGGSGMVLKPGPLVSAIETQRTGGPCHVVLLTPQGRRFRQEVAAEFAERGNVVLVCGRYEGFDERVRAYCDEEISVGDFVLMGGEAAALAIIEASVRLLPGVLGDSDSPLEESHADGLLEYPQYTRPRVFRGRQVPEVLLGGNHAEIAAWRRREAIARTVRRRGDLIATADLRGEERAFANRLGRDEESG